MDEVEENIQVVVRLRDLIILQEELIQQLEQEHEDRIGFLREKHELEGRIANLQDMLESSAEQESLVVKLRKDLKRAKALLKDAHCVAENTQTEGTSNIIMKQLKQQVKVDFIN